MYHTEDMEVNLKIIEGTTNFRKKNKSQMYQSAREPMSWTARTSKNVLTFRMCLLVKNFPESDDGSFIQMSLISTDLEVKGTTL